MKFVPFCFAFWIGMECFDYSRRNGTELTTLIKAATKNFSDSNKLGQAGFGAVYKVSCKVALSPWSTEIQPSVPTISPTPL